jgi:hypothetical protein
MTAATRRSARPPARRDLCPGPPLAVGPSAAGAADDLQRRPAQRICWRWPGSPRARRPGQTACWFVKAYRRRWGAKTRPGGTSSASTWSCSGCEAGGASAWLWLVAWAFFWLNLGAKDGTSSDGRLGSSMCGGCPKRLFPCLTGLPDKSTNDCIPAPDGPFRRRDNKGNSNCWSLTDRASAR